VALHGHPELIGAQLSVCVAWSQHIISSERQAVNWLWLICVRFWTKEDAQLLLPAGHAPGSAELIAKKDTRRTTRSGSQHHAIRIAITVGEERGQFRN
jgi:hypothetical protein